MILRRIAEGIKNQDWFIVVIEIFVVVIGIYIGLQVDDWNKARQDRAEEMRVLQQLGIEVEAAIEAKNNVLTTSREGEGFLIEAIEIIQGDREGDDLSFEQCRALWRSHIINPNFNGLLTYEELALSGNLGLLSNPALRSALIAFQNQVNNDTAVGEIAIGDAINVVDTYGDILPRQWFPETQTSIVDCQITLLRQNQTIINNLQSNSARSWAMSYRMEREINTLTGILELIKGDNQ